MKARSRAAHEPDGAGQNDERDPKELSAQENANLCEGCVKCCTYITVEIDSPRAAWEYDQWIWALYHRGIQLYVERPERWFLHVETRCEKLDPEGRCSIHGRHPVLCRDYDPRTCERRLPLADMRAWFNGGEELEDWLRAKRPAHYRRLLAYRRDMPPGPPVADARAASSLVAIAPAGSGAKAVAAPERGTSGRVTRPRR